MGRSRAGIAALLVVLAAAGVPTYLFQRGPYAKAYMDYSAVADVIDRNAAPGDCLILDNSTTWAPGPIRPLTAARPAVYQKLRDHLIRVDDELTCKTCGKRFEIPSMHSLVFVDQLDGLPKVDDEEEEPGLGAPGPGTGASTTQAPSASGPDGNTPSTPAPRQRKGYAPPKAWR